MSVIRNLEILILSVLFLFVGTGCVIDPGVMDALRDSFEATTKSEQSKPEIKRGPEYYFADIDTLRSIDSELKRQKNPERLKTSIDKLRNPFLKDRLLAELNKNNFDTMQVMVVEELKTLLAAAIKKIPVEKKAVSYKGAGRRWGLRLAYHNITPPKDDFSGNCIDNPVLLPDIDCVFVHQLSSDDQIRGGLDYFSIHSELKRAFHEGFRLGYEARTADLVLGPHIQLAGGLIGNKIAKQFRKTIDKFEHDWVDTLRNAIDIFITLISEGSQADREEFINNFIGVYRAKYEETQRRKRKMMGMTSEGGTTIYINMKEVGSALDIPSDSDLKNEVYKQTFVVMGHELGRRLRHNLIKRDELIDLLRRSRPVFSEAPKLSFKECLKIMLKGFEDGYKSSDAVDVFLEVAKVARLVER